MPLVCIFLQAALIFVSKKPHTDAEIAFPWHFELFILTCMPPNCFHINFMNYIYRAQRQTCHLPD